MIMRPTSLKSCQCVADMWLNTDGREIWSNRLVWLACCGVEFIDPNLTLKFFFCCKQDLVSFFNSFEEKSSSPVLLIYKNDHNVY